MKLLGPIQLLILLSAPLAAQGTAAAPHDFTPADVEFVQGMIMHHAQAVVMSDWCATHGARSDLAILCKRIALSQRDEIKVMRKWLTDRGQSAPDPAAMPGMAMGNGKLMPGMLSPEEMKHLDAAKDTAFDRLYLTGMIKHHEGALSMVATLFGKPGGGQQSDLFAIATDIDAGQRVEIARMETMLSTLTPNHSS